MKTIKWAGLIAAFILLIFGYTSQRTETMAQDQKKQYNPLTPEEEWVILKKGTERPGTGEYLHHKEDGTYTCKRCDAPLYRSADKFDSHCGWPSFDDEIEGAIKRVPDPDGVRTEIQCANCGAHLGHVFKGEGFTPKNIRHCVNSISLNFEPVQAANRQNSEQQMEIAYFAGGCFWGVEYHFEQLPGVHSVVSGYMGGHKDNPTYEEVSYKDTGHAETVRVEFDPEKTSYEKLARLFFEIHDPTQVNRQGPDVGKQYRSAVYYSNTDQKKVAEKLITILEEKGYDVATQIEPADRFWEAEDYHQDYYEKTGKQPYCHVYTKRF
jgi:peptide methionine sulfoxide reductase msrA/msrB